MNGFLLLNKPQNITSNKALQHIKKRLSLNKVGHLGTLDPMATGLLVLAVDRATKFSSYFLNSDKSYDVEIQLGAFTNTDDAMGEIIEEYNLNICEKKLKSTLNSFVGESFQKPPYFSALKHKGKPLYKYTRQGININKDPRKIIIHSIENFKFSKNICSFRIFCSKGTYIRSIARDLGVEMKCGGYLRSLSRIKQDTFSISNSYELDDLQIEHLININEAFKQYEKIKLDEYDTKAIKTGLKVRFVEHFESNGVYRIFSNDDFLGCVEIDNFSIKSKQLV